LGVLWRREFLAYREMRAWTLVYGRRKTGKSFMVRLYEGDALFVTVTRAGSCIVEEPGGGYRVVEQGDAVRAAVERLRRGGTVVLDEFQRLPAQYWDLLALASPRGRLVLVASSLGVVERVFASNSPLLGLVAPFRVDPIRFADALASLAPRASARRAVEWAVLLAEPWLVPHAPDDLEVEPWAYLAEAAPGLAQMAKGLVGEVFEEEERALTRLYDSILHLLGAGVWKAGEIGALLYARGLMSRPAPATGILEKMAAMGLVEKTRLWRTRGHRVYYRHKSHLLAIIYGLKHYLAVDEIQVSPAIVAEYARRLHARELQFAVASLLAEYHGGTPAYTILPHAAGDVDVVVLDPRGKRPIAAYEVKAGDCTRRDAIKALEAARTVGAPRAGLVCVGDPPARAPQELEVLGPRDLARAAAQVAARAARGALGSRAPRPS